MLSLFLKVGAPRNANRRVVRLPSTKNGGGALQLHRRGVLEPADVVKDTIIVLAYATKVRQIIQHGPRD